MTLKSTQKYLLPLLKLEMLLKLQCKFLELLNQRFYAEILVLSIENTYQVKLFERVGRKIVLSEVGKDFYQKLRMLLQVQKMLQKIYVF